MNLGGLSGTEAGAWVAAIAGVFALVRQVYQAVRKRAKEKDEVKEALDRAPEIRHQLELGNVGEAVKQLNIIIQSQAEHVKRQDTRLTECDGKIEHLEDRNEALEAEANSWESRYREEVQARQQDRRDSDRQIADLHAEIEEMKRTFARTLAQLRSEIEDGEETA